MLKARCRVWLEKNGRPVFGDGRVELLERIDRCGSIRAAGRIIQFLVAEGARALPCLLAVLCFGEHNGIERLAGNIA